MRIYCDFLNWWQSLPYRVDSVAFYFFNFPIRYYGLSYILAFYITYGLVIYRVKNEKRFFIFKEKIQELIIAAVLGVFLGGRIGYVIFYNFSYYFSRPLEIFLPISTLNGLDFTGFNGMSYHGGLIGSLVMVYAFTFFNKIDFTQVLDLFVPTVSLGYTLGRLGNFMNGELYGRQTSLPIGMYFPSAERYVLRHPSQLYEAFFEGLVLFSIMWVLKNKTFMRGNTLWFYLIFYGLIRFIIEYFREPDYHIGFVFLYLTMGQILSIIMILLGILFIVFMPKIKNMLCN